MFEKEIKAVIEQYITNSWYTSGYRKVSIQEDITGRIYTAISASEDIVNDIVKYPDIFKNIPDIVKQEFPLLHSCITFMRNEHLTVYSFRALLVDEHHLKEFDKAVEALKLRIIQEELKPYADRLFNELPLLESKASALFKEN